MKTLRIPSHINITLYKVIILLDSQAPEKKVMFLQDSKKSSVWFLTEDKQLEVYPGDPGHSRIVFGKSTTIRTIKKCLMSLEIGHKRTLTLQGVGYKATVLPDANTLAIKVSSVPPFLFKIPNDISIKLEKQSIICWSYHPTIIDNFFKKIIIKVKLASWN